LLCISSGKEPIHSRNLDGLESNSNINYPSTNVLKWIIIILFIYFGLRLIFFALVVSPSIPPDEVTHLAITKIYSQVNFLPENSPDTYKYGLVTNIPYLYYWIMGKLLAVNILGIPALIFLRLLNIPFAFATVYFTFCMLRLLTNDRLTQILLVVTMTNTIMFSFLSASVSYDNLTNLLAVMAVYYLLAFFKDRSVNLLLVSILCQLAGCLTKITFLPLVLIMNILLFIHEVRNIRAMPSVLKDYIYASGKRGLILIFAILAFVVLNIQLYGGNVLHYKKLNPKIYKVLAPEIAMQNRISARDMIYLAFKEERISLNKALEMASQISHNGDRRDTINLIKTHTANEERGVPLLGPLEYITPWSLRMMATIFGIFGHLTMFNKWPAILPFVALIILTGLGIIIRWRPRETKLLPAYLAVIAAFYGIFLMYAVNYRSYLYYENFALALQGRYIFPVIGPIYILSCYYIMQLFRGKYARWGIFVMAVIIFIAYDLPYFLIRATPEWFATPFK
jgi:hypothetical protein